MRSFAHFAVAIIICSLVVSASEAKQPKNKTSRAHSHKNVSKQGQLKHKRGSSAAKGKSHPTKSRTWSKRRDVQHGSGEADNANTRHRRFHDNQHERHEKFHEQQRKKHEKLHKEHRRDHGDHAKHSSDRHGFDESNPGVQHPREKQRLNEDRKLQHRLRQAEHLRQIGERNGNPRLAEVADRMEQTALEHYDKRLQRIDEGYDDSVLDRTQDVAAEDPQRNLSRRPGDPPTPVTPKQEALSNFNQQMRRQLTGERQDLQRRLQTVERLRHFGELHNDRRLLATADRLERTALERFDQRVHAVSHSLTAEQQTQFDDFYQRSLTEALAR